MRCATMKMFKVCMQSNEKSVIDGIHDITTSVIRMSPIDEYLQELVQVSKLPNDQERIIRLANVFNLDPKLNGWILRINNGPSSVNVDIDAYNLFEDEWPAFNELAKSFIFLASQLNPWSCLESFDLYTSFLNDLSVAFNNNARGFLLSAVVRDSINVILPLLMKLDYQLYYKENFSTPRLTYLALIVLKLFNHIRSQINDINPAKKNLILFISNKLCLIYFRIGNPLLCRNIFSNMNNANLQFKSFPLVAQMQYRFYLSKFYLIKDQLVDSLGHLTWCLTNCPVTSTNNVVKILKYLIPVGIVVGKCPNFAFITQTYFPNGNVPTYMHTYQSISKAVRGGNFQIFSLCIHQQRQYLKDASILLMLKNKSKVIILRNLIQKVWLYSGKPSNLDYDAVKYALKLSLGTSSDLFENVNAIDDLVTENVFVALIDQNLLKGKLFPRLRKVALSKTDAFTRIDLINETRFLSNAKSDAWMN